MKYEIYLYMTKTCQYYNFIFFILLLGITILQYRIINYKNIEQEFNYSQR